MTARNAIPVAKKYTQQSSGIWETIRRAFAVDPDRSNGVPVKHFRNPTPGGLDPKTYDDPVTLPAADIADNPYWKRDVRRSYPKLSTISQGDAVGLLTMGNAAAPSPKLLAGEEGSKQLVTAKEEGEKGLSQYLGKEKGAGKSILSANGLPPMPVSFKAAAEVRYLLDEEQSYENAYPCRNFQ